MAESFAHKFAQARSVQAQVRALRIFAQKHPGISQITIESMGEGALASFGAPESAAKGGHELFLEILSSTEELMGLEQTLAKLHELGAGQELIDKAYEQAKAIAKKLYPELPARALDDSKGEGHGR